VIWLGQAHEAPLAKVLNNNNKSIAILDSGILTTLPMRNPRGQALKDTVDTHVWLDPNNAVRIGFFIAALRSQQLPEHREAYWKNARDFAQTMFLTAQRYSSTSKAQPYWSYHDAYQYLERPLNLKFMGALTMIHMCHQPWRKSSICKTVVCRAKCVCWQKHMLVKISTVN
jgi:ABC-type Zn2+ transport system, periplasmic component/surface adhesin